MEDSGFYQDLQLQLNNSIDFNQSFPRFLLPNSIGQNDARVTDKKNLIGVSFDLNYHQGTPQMDPTHKDNNPSNNPLNIAPAGETGCENLVSDHQNDEVRQYDYDQLELLFNNPFQQSDQLNPAMLYTTTIPKHPFSTAKLKDSRSYWEKFAYQQQPLEKPLLTKNFPSDFRPREAKNMGHAEKVRDWMTTVPIYLLDDFTWFNNCYPGSVPSEDSSDDVYWSQSDEVDILELQARKVTRFVTQLYELQEERISKQERLSANTIPYSGYSDDDYYID